MQFLKKTVLARLLPFGIIAAGLVIYTFLGMVKGKPQPKAVTSRPVRVKVATLKPATRTPNVLLFGILQSTQHATISARVTSVVKSLLVRDGEAVHKGQRLVNLDAADITLSLRQARAHVRDIRAKQQLQNQQKRTEALNLKKQQEALDLMLRSRRRLTALSQQQFISQDRLEKEKIAVKQQELSLNQAQNRLDTLVSQIQQTAAALTRAKAQYELGLNRLRYTNVVAPFDGVVTRVSAANGEHVREGTPLLDITSTHDKEVRALVPQSVVRQLKGNSALSKKVHATAEIDGRSYRLSFLRFSGRVKPGQLGQEAVFAVEREYFPVASGHVFHVILSLPSVKNAFRLPLSALYQNNKIYRVRDGRLQRMNVNVVGRQYVGERTSRFLFKSQELRSGDTVMTSSLPNAINGLAVTPIKAAHEK